MSAAHWKRVCREHPCPVCEHADWCLVSADGTTAICPRTESGKRAGDAGYLHRLTNEPRAQASRRFVVSFVAPATDLTALALRYQEALASARRAAFAASLGLSVESLAALSAGIRSKLVEIGLLAGERAAASKPLADHMSDFKAALTAKANTADHVAMVTGRAKRVFSGCGFKFFSDIAATRVQSFLNGLRTGTGAKRGISASSARSWPTRSGRIRTGTGAKRGISAQTFNFHLAAVKQFCRWMVKHGRAAANPVDPLEPLNVKVDRRRDRRALTVDELRNLLTTTAAAPKRGRLTGPNRSLLYRVAMETGLRSNELRTLTARSFDLNESAPTVTVAAGNSKNRREDTLPVRLELAVDLRAHLSGKPADAQVFPIPKDRKSAAKMFRVDIEAAGIVFRDEANEVVDFHALRHTFVTNLARGKVHPKIAQALARHSTISLTMDRYTHTDLGEQADALKVLPSLLAPPANAPVVLASCLASKHAKQRTPLDSDRRSDKEKGDEGEPAEVTRKQAKRLQNKSSGSVSESNRLGALFTPPTGFEDLGRHQPCKHSQGEQTHCKARGTRGKTGFARFGTVGLVSRKRDKTREAGCAGRAGGG